jgi:protein TonB
VSTTAWRRGDAPAFLVSLLLNLGIVYGVGTALLHRPPVFERIEVDLRERVAPPPLQLRPPPQARRPPPAPAVVPLPRPTIAPEKLHLGGAEVRPAPRPSIAPAPIPVPTAPPSPVAVPLRLAREGPPAPASVPPAQASVAPPPPALPAPVAAVPRASPGVLEAYYAQVRARIEAEKRYPRWARKARLEGRVTVDFRLGPDGALKGASVRESSGHEVLDQAALAAVERAAPYPPLPTGAGELPETLTVVLAFVLR